MKKIRNIYILSIAFILFSSLAWASGDGEAASGKWMNFLYRVINFTIVVGILYYFLGKKIGGFLSGRSRQIETDLQKLDERRQEAEASLQEVEARIAGLESEKAAILEKAREQGQTVKAELIAEAEKTAARIQTQAIKAAEQEVHQALAQIREQAAQQIMAEAEKIISSQLKKKEHEDLIQDSLKKVVLH